ncbi:peptidylprolyl isomerase RRD1 PWA37_001126 [Arxiozyma heterogenica]|uniref:peptidylprolyl isomerase RRD1 n=1 Tax=Arxiozyma heterogenica TaxID=278026 RepID=UPI002EDEA535
MLEQQQHQQDVLNVFFSKPQKRIFDSQSLLYFQRSVAIQRIRHYLKKYVQLMTGRPIPNIDGYVPHYKTTHRVVHLLDTLYSLFLSTPPLKGPRRFGNMADRLWHDKKHEVIRLLIREILVDLSTRYQDGKNEHLIDELQYYIENSFGSKVRLDYGTGHELSFLAFIASLDMLQLWGDIDVSTAPNSKGNDKLTNFADDLMFIWYKYYHLIKSLILVYNLEPAGSHGVWGLDDHFHLAYIWGASQWSNPHNCFLLPRDLLVDQQYGFYKDQNFFAQGISFICQVKTGPFKEHSPILFDILHTVRSWQKIQRGLLKMYDDEVLNKFPVVQHFWFGDGFFPWKDQITGKDLPLVEANPNTNTITNNDREFFTSVPTASNRSFDQYHVNNIYNSTISSSSMFRNVHVGANDPLTRLRDTSLLSSSSTNISTTIRPQLSSGNSVSNSTRALTNLCSRKGSGIMGPPSIRNVKNILPMNQQKNSLKK